MKKNIALFGGSFNPPHAGHFETAIKVLEELKADEVWFLFSVNRLKDASQYAGTQHRIAMAEIMLEQYKTYPFKLSNIEEELGTHITYEVLTQLKNKYPENNFAWVMGSDSLETFHLWKNYEDIIENFPVGIINRGGYAEAANKSVTALSYPHLKHENATDIFNAGSGWAYISNANNPLSSSAILKAIHSGDAHNSGIDKSVLGYILQNNLYGISKNCQNLTPAAFTLK